MCTQDLAPRLISFAGGLNLLFSTWCFPQLRPEGRRSGRAASRCASAAARVSRGRAGPLPQVRAGDGVVSGTRAAGGGPAFPPLFLSGAGGGAGRAEPPPPARQGRAPPRGVRSRGCLCRARTASAGPLPPLPPPAPRRRRRPRPRPHSKCRRSALGSPLPCAPGEGAGGGSSCSAAGWARASGVSASGGAGAWQPGGAPGASPLPEGAAVGAWLPGGRGRCVPGRRWRADLGFQRRPGVTPLSAWVRNAVARTELRDPPRGRGASLPPPAPVAPGAAEPEQRLGAALQVGAAQNTRWEFRHAKNVFG